jgi:hypothetical protein
MQQERSVLTELVLKDEQIGSGLYESDFLD